MRERSRKQGKWPNGIRIIRYTDLRLSGRWVSWRAGYLALEARCEAQREALEAAKRF
jgi:hypothetical protein